MQNNESLTAEQANEITQKALKKVDDCVYLILRHGVDNRREYAVRCAEMPLTYVLLETGSILSDKQYYNIGEKTQKAVKQFLAYKQINPMPNWKAIPQTSNFLQRIFGPRQR
jgi:hypothetical protein